MPAITPSVFNAFLRRGALWLPYSETRYNPTPAAATFILQLLQHGYAVEAEALPYVCALPERILNRMSEDLAEIFRDNYNWASLRRNWENSCDETWSDHILAAFANILVDSADIKVDRLPCGHYIPEELFDMEVYNGCPLCGTPFVGAPAEKKEARVLRKKLRRMAVPDVEDAVAAIVTSEHLPGGTDFEDLEAFLDVCPQALPTVDTDIPVEEIRIFLADYIRRKSGTLDGIDYLQTPRQLLRFLWEPVSGQKRLVRPKDIIDRNLKKYLEPAEQITEYAALKNKLKLHFTRAEGRRIALWFVNLPLSAEQVCISMHSSRGMWVRVFRAIRMSEHARNNERLHEIADRFYCTRYPVWQGEYETAYIAGNTSAALPLLAAHPGFFARHFFSAVRRFESDAVLDTFDRIASKLPLRMLTDLVGNVMPWFAPIIDCRVVRLASGRTVSVPLPAGITADNDANAALAARIRQRLMDCVKAVYASMPHRLCAKVSIAPELFGKPVPTSARSQNVGVTGNFVPGEMFKLSSDMLRVFIHWGAGMPAQHYDMDLSALLLKKNEVTNLFYADLNPCEGAVHSGDFQNIPDNAGVAEYVSLDLAALEKQGYDTVFFTVNAYSMPDMSDTTIIGWLDSASPFAVNERTGVAYNPADVQCMLRIASSTLSRGLVFAMLDIGKRTMMTMEVQNETRNVEGIDVPLLLAAAERIKSKLTLGQLLTAVTEAQGGTIVAPSEADIIVTEQNCDLYI